MPKTIEQNATYVPPPKRPRAIFEPGQSLPLKRSKQNQNSATTSTETTVSYDACPMPSVLDYFYEDLIPKATELSQLFPTLCHDAYVVRRWLGSVGRTIYWTMVMEEMEKSTDTLNPSRYLAGLIARSLAKLRAPQKEASSPKFHTLCRILRFHLGIGAASRAVVFSESRSFDFLPELTPDSAS